MATWLPGVDSEFDAVFGLRPNLYEAYRDFADVFVDQRLLDPDVLEQCRLRVAQLLRCESEVAAARFPGLSNWPTDPRFSDDQRACLTLAEQFVLDPHGVTAEHRAAVVEHFGEAGLIALIEALAVFDGFARFRTILGITREVP